MNPPNERFQIHYVRGWDKWIVVDLKYTRDNEVRDWRKKGLPGKQPIWKSPVKQDAENLAALLNKNAADDNSLVKKAERGQSEYKPWENRRKRAAAPVVVPNFKTCQCGARYKGEKHCEVQ